MIKELNLADDAPWKQRFRAPKVAASQIADLSPQCGIVAHNGSGTLQWYAWDVPSGDLRQLTDTPGGHVAYLTISPDGKWVYYLDDEKGNEIGHYVRMSIESGEIQDITPDLPKYSSWGICISRSGNRIGIMAAYDDKFHIFCLDVADDGQVGNLREIYTSDHLLLGILLSEDGRLISFMSTERSGKTQYSLVTYDTDSGERIAELWDGEDNSIVMMPPSPLEGDPRLLATTTRTGTESLLIWNPRTGERRDLSFEDVTGSVAAFDWSPDGRKILFQTFNMAVQQLYLHDLETGKTTQLHYPDGVNYGLYFASDGSEIFSHWESPTQPTCILALSPSTGEMLRTVISAGDVPPGHEWKSITYPSSDGQIIQGWLSLPPGDGPFPTVIETHGGPTAVQPNSFVPGAQAWLDHGFAYLTINYRGSTTFGRDFEQKITGQPGHWEIEDLVAARNWLVQEKIAQPEKILLTGWSYGGYLTLLGLGKAPDLWAGGMAGIAIADWVIMYEDQAETLRGYQVALFEGTLDDRLEQYQVSSPISYVEDVQAPVLIIQGRNDTRTVPRNVEAYEAKMRANGKDIQVHWFDTGHAGSFGSIEESIRHQELMLRFAYRVLGV